MAEVKWIKITTNMFEDEKIDFIESLPECDAILIVWIKLLTLAGKNNSNGFIFLTENIPYNPEMLAHKFRRPLNTVKLALETLKKLEMIEFDDSGFLKITNWEKHQNIEGMDKIREQTRKRVAKYRGKQKRLTDSNVTCNVTVTDCNGTDIEEERDIDIDKEKSKKYKYSPQQMEFAELLFSEIKKNNPNHKKPNLKNWANTFRLMQDRDNRKDEDITKVIYWCQQDDFWYKNILSADKLRKQFDKLYIQMGDKQKKKSNSFNDFNQRNYSKHDMSELEKKLLGR